MGKEYTRHYETTPIVTRPNIVFSDNWDPLNRTVEPFAHLDLGLGNVFGIVSSDGYHYNGVNVIQQGPGAASWQTTGLMLGFTERKRNGKYRIFCRYKPMGGRDDTDWEAQEIRIRHEIQYGPNQIYRWGHIRMTTFIAGGTRQVHFQNQAGTFTAIDRTLLPVPSWASESWVELEFAYDLEENQMLWIRVGGDELYLTDYDNIDNRLYTQDMGAVAEYRTPVSQFNFGVEWGNTGRANRIYLDQLIIETL